MTLYFGVASHCFPDSGCSVYVCSMDDIALSLMSMHVEYIGSSVFSSGRVSTEIGMPYRSLTNAGNLISLLHIGVAFQGLATPIALFLVRLATDSMSCSFWIVWSQCQEMGVFKT